MMSGLQSFFKNTVVTERRDEISAAQMKTAPDVHDQRKAVSSVFTWIKSCEGMAYSLFMLILNSMTSPVLYYF